MIITTENVQVQDNSPVRPHKEPRPKPTFWAENITEAINRGIDRATARIFNKNTNVQAIEFGWGDCGLSHITVYVPIGQISTLNQNNQTTWYINFYFGHQSFPVFSFTTNYKDAEKAKKILLSLV